MTRRQVACWVVGGLVTAAATAAAVGADWPMWRYDAGRTAASPAPLPADLDLHWVREYPSLEPTWEDRVNQDRMPLDRCYEPIVVGGRLVFGSNADDAVRALDTDDGRELWICHAEGPVRVPPAAANGRIYFASDDGHLYCVGARSGDVLWRHRGGPDNRKILGNGRLISAWPARGGPVVADGAVYYGASIWPFMGTFVHALDAVTGEARWTADGYGAEYIAQPHGGAVGFGSVAPQGAFAVTGDRLIVPCGRSVPACFDRTTGRLVHYWLAGSPTFQVGSGVDRKREGGSHVSAIGPLYFNHRGINLAMYDVETGGAYQMWNGTRYPVMTSDTLYISGDKIVAYDLESLEHRTEIVQRDGDPDEREYWGIDSRWETPVDAVNGLIRAGDRLYAAGRDRVTAIEVADDGSPRVVWQIEPPGEPVRMVAGDDRLFVITRDGRICCYGPGKRDPIYYPLEARRALKPPTGRPLRWTGAPAAATASDGYCIVHGVGDGDLLEGLLRETDLRLIAVDPDPDRLEPIRGQLDGAPEYGTRIALLHGDPMSSGLPPYLAEVTLFGTDPAVLPPFLRPSEGWHRTAAWLGLFLAIFAVGAAATGRSRAGLAAAIAAAAVFLVAIGGAWFNGHRPGNGPPERRLGEIDAQWVRAVFETLRPYGGTAVLPCRGDKERAAWQELARRCDLAGAVLRDTPDGLCLVRSGPLPGAASWTHTNGDIANSAKSDDDRVRLPLGLLWFGGSSHDDVLPRHGHGPSEQVIGGRLFIEGINMMSARDVYTGRVLWKREFEGLNTFGVYYDASYRADPLDTTYNQVHIPGANLRGANYVAAEDGLYLIVNNACQVLDPATGETTATIRLAGAGQDGTAVKWGYIGIAGDLLIAGANSSDLTEIYGLKDLALFDLSSSRSIVVMNRHTGEEVWRRDARYAFRHNAIVVGGDLLYCIDSLPTPMLEAMERRGDVPDVTPALLALNLKTGDEVWSHDTEVFGTWLGYSKDHDLLLESGRNSRDMAPGEPSDRMRVYRAANGEIAWDRYNEHSGPCMLHGRTIYLNAHSSDGSAIDLLTGEPVTRLHPLTGQPVPWMYNRYYGCNSALCSEHLLTFRSGAAGYYDLDGDGGTGNLGGFKSGCTANLIAADGVLNAPDYTRTCTCSYQNQTSLALVHMPDVETWTFSAIPAPNLAATPVRRAGINFGAPGDRVADGGTLWLDYPSRGGPSPDLPVAVDGEDPHYYRRHASQISGDGLRWVSASGVEGVVRITVPVAAPGTDSRPYRVRLHFAEPLDLRAGRRVFSVALQGETVVEDLDIVAEAGGPRRCLVREFASIEATDRFDVELKPGDRSNHLPLLCGIEIEAEGW